MPPQKLLITGGTGFIGQQLCKTLLTQGHTLTLLVRNPTKATKLFGSNNQLQLINSIQQLSGIEEFATIINLAGEPIIKRWNPRNKKLIMASRLDTTRQLIDYINNTKTKPKQFISGSAIGYYGNRESEELTEASVAGSSCFSRDVCIQWEAIAQQAANYGVRVCCMRIGIVLGKTGGALASMLTPFSYGLGGKLGHGRQWMSWIHIADVIGCILELIRNKTISGAVNVTAPNPVTNTEFTEILGRTLQRPTIMTVPAFMLQLLMGEVANELLLTGQKVIPKQLNEHGYQFLYPNLSAALENIIKS
ncbi:hypothetical protein TI05_08315 [Achromatium sp. WMS3]|nr:hypothetical protein TI05_08315 [Achromatium sp. WMS3]